MSDLIYRRAAIKAIEDLPNCYNGFSDTYDKSCIIGVLEELPSAQPDLRYDEWCTDCKEYDQEKHCCPRFNHVIRTTLQEVQEEQPEIVRCKDCMHWCDHKRLNIPWCRELHIDMGAEDFCSMAKRRE